MAQIFICPKKCKTVDGIAIPQTMHEDTKKDYPEAVCGNCGYWAEYDPEPQDENKDPDLHKVIKDGYYEKDDKGRLKRDAKVENPPEGREPYLDKQPGT